MIYYTRPPRSDEIYHFGIKGQKWGVRNGPPYPLSEGKKSRREKRMERLVGGSNSSIAKKIAKGGAITLLSAAALGGVAYLAYRNAISKEKKLHDLQSMFEYPQIKIPHSEEDDQFAVNMDNDGSPGYFMNCSMCSTAYELRRRGYNVKAQTSRVGRELRDISSWWKDTTSKDFVRTRKFDDLKNKLNSQPEGSRGNIIAGVGPFDSRHSMVWEKKEGKIKIRDCQTDMEYDNIDNSIIKHKTRHGYQFLRTDNREINWDTIYDAIRNGEEEYHGDD